MRFGGRETGGTLCMWLSLTTRRCVGDSDAVILDSMACCTIT